MYIIQYNWGNDAEIHAFASTKNWSIQQELYTNPVVGFFTKVAGTLVRVAKWYGYFSLISSTTAIASSSTLSSPQHIHHSCSKRTCIITPLTLDRKRVSVNLDSILDWQKPLLPRLQPVASSSVSTRFLAVEVSPLISMPKVTCIHNDLQQSRLLLNPCGFRNRLWVSMTCIQSFLWRSHTSVGKHVCQALIELWFELCFACLKN